jgi:hypothetical protein
VIKSRTTTFILLLVLMTGYAAVFPAFEQARKNVRSFEVKGMTLPPVVIKLLSLEFRTIAADFLFVRASQFYGGKVTRREDATKDDWMWLYRNLDVITELDPYFEDPYQLGNALLIWDAGMITETNRLLEKGVAARSWDWQLPFFVGFNKFYFLNENKEAADYLLLASKRPGSWEFLPTLASRLYSKAGRTRAAITFLLNFWENEKDPGIKHGYEVRITALRRVLNLEEALDRYRKQYGGSPKRLERLIEAGIIREIPKDPYGGVFYIDKDGSIQTTSKLAFPPKKREDTKN